MSLSREKVIELRLRCDRETGLLDELEPERNDQWCERFAALIAQELQGEPVAKYIGDIGNSKTPSHGSIAYLVYSGKPMTPGDLLYAAPRSGEDARDAARYRFLRNLLHSAKGSASVDVNDHLASYEECEPWKEVRIQWYPNTPVGFNYVEAATLDEAIDKAIREGKA